MAINKKLREKLIKNSTLETTAVLSQSILFQPRDQITTRVPALNTALSGRVNGGLLPGILQIAGPSKHFKTAFALLIITSFLEQYPDGIVLFYDSEFGTPQSYFQSFNIDPERVVHCPITNIEQLKFDIMAQLKELTAQDKVLLFTDSIGGLASLKEVTDAEEQKSVADMSRAKQLKSLFRMTGPLVVLKNIPWVIINHSYKEIGLFPKDIVGGGTGSVYHSNDIWIIRRKQVKETSGEKELLGYEFIIVIEKSRLVKEKSEIPITVTFDRGIQRWSGMLELSMEAGIVERVGSKKSYKYKCHSRITDGDVLYDKDDIEYNGDFWKGLLEDESPEGLKQYIENKYRLANGPIYSPNEESESV